MKKRIIALSLSLVLSFCGCANATENIQDAKNSVIDSVDESMEEISLTEELEDKIYEKYNIEIPKVYESVCRTGCMGCPYGSWKGDTQKELKLLNGKQKEFVMEYFKESYDILGVYYNGNKKNMGYT